MTDFEEVFRAIVALIVLAAIAPVFQQLLTQYNTGYADLLRSVYEIAFIALIVFALLGLILAVADMF
ncbi:hypothetical protein [Halobellus ordinarius]|uniref:hypothetical protein n=1 Tax=Halobellus ordinarius TaxID=3075120 RepID=UPI0028804E28|nr:hypothetical protein [Halobellus sp. ZY16]